MLGSPLTPVVVLPVKWCYWFFAAQVTRKMCIHRKSVCVKCVPSWMDVLPTLPPEFFQEYIFSTSEYLQLCYSPSEEASITQRFFVNLKDRSSRDNVDRQGSRLGCRLGTSTETASCENLNSSRRVNMF